MKYSSEQLINLSQTTGFRAEIIEKGSDQNIIDTIMAMDAASVRVNGKHVICWPSNAFSLVGSDARKLALEGLAESKGGNNLLNIPEPFLVVSVLMHRYPCRK